MRSLISALIVLTACKSSSKTPSPAPAPHAPAANSAPLSPAFAGTLTADRIMKVALPVPGDPWDDALAKLEAQVGKPTYTDGKEYAWGVADASQCTYFQLDSEKRPDGTLAVGAVQHPSAQDKAWPDCLKATGKKDADADPNSAGPPTDGKPIPVAALLEGVAKGKSKWIGKRVKVSGFLGGVSTASDGQGGPTTVTISLAGTKSDFKTVTSCTLAKGAAAPTTILQWTPMTVEGDVSETFGGELENCKVVP